MIDLSAFDARRTFGFESFALGGRRRSALPANAVLYHGRVLTYNGRTITYAR